MLLRNEITYFESNFKGFFIKHMSPLHLTFPNTGLVSGEKDNLVSSIGESQYIQWNLYLQLGGGGS